jgi:lipoprotein NlpI/transglutaminase-like putative cysteine protease
MKFGPLLSVVCLAVGSASASPAPTAPTAPIAPASAAAQANKPAANAARKISKGGFEFSIEPTPTWVVPAVEEPNPPADRGSMHYPVIEQQTRLAAGSRWSYQHFARVVDEASALGSASQFEIQFDPSYETLAIHHLFILRGGKKIDKLDASRVELLQRETELEKRMYNGRVTASILLQDVRVGDRIEIAYSLRGLNPVFGGKYIDTIWPGSDKGPTGQFQFRLLAPANRNIQYKAASLDLSVRSHVNADGTRETIFRHGPMPQIRFDAGAPPSVSLAYQLQLSEYADWSSVRRWGQDLFLESTAQSTLLDDKAAEIREHAADPAAKLLAALQFVQKDIRYFGNELGINTHKPTAPEKVLRQRFGDCKDKVFLLIALLRRLDIPAQPVLVSAYYRSHVQDTLPSPLAFNHVIVRVDLKGTSYWLDATRDHQTGPLEQRQARGLGQGLWLADDVAGLLELPSAHDELRASVDDHVIVRQFTQDPVLESRITYRGDLAEAWRNAMATVPIHDIETQLNQQYSRAFPKLQTTSTLEVQELANENALMLTQKFTIPDFWHFNEKTQLTMQMLFWSLVDPLRYPPSQSRTQPLGIALPGIFEHRITIDLPEDTLPTGLPEQRYEDADSSFSIQINGQIMPSRVENLATLHLFADEVSPDDWTTHVSKISKLDPHLGVGLQVPSIPKAQLQALVKELMAFDENIKQKKLSFKTQLEMESQARVVTMSFALDGGRLSPATRSQALIARALANDNLGQFERAKSDLDEALVLSPSLKEARNAASANALARRDYPRAIELANQSLSADPRDSEALFNRAKAYYLAQQYFPARQDLDDLLKDRSYIHRGYPVLMLYLTDLHMGGDGAEALSRFSPSDLPNDWPRPLIDAAVGKIDADAALISAKNTAPANQHLCEAFFYLGEKLYAYGEDKRALNYFESSINQGTTEFFEDWASHNEMFTILKKPRKPSTH